MLKVSKQVRKVVAAAVVASLTGGSVASAEGTFSRAVSAFNSLSQRTGNSGSSHSSNMHKFAQKAKSYTAQKLNQQPSSGGQSKFSSLHQSFKNKVKSGLNQPGAQASPFGSPTGSSKLSNLKSKLQQSTAKHSSNQPGSMMNKLKSKLDQNQAGKGNTTPGKQGGLVEKLKGKLNQQHAGNGANPAGKQGGVVDKIKGKLNMQQAGTTNAPAGKQQGLMGKFAQRMGLQSLVADPGPPPSPTLPLQLPNGVVINQPNPDFIVWQQKHAQFLEEQKNAGNGGGPALPPVGNGGGPAVPPVGNGDGPVADNGPAVPMPAPEPDHFGNAVQLATTVLGAVQAVRPAPVFVNDYAPPVVYAAPAPQYVEAPQQPVVLGGGSPDLVVEDLQLAAPATKLAGPAYQVTFRNQGTAPAGAFRVGLYTVANGSLDDKVRAEVEVQGLSAGESHTLTLRLPQQAVQLVSYNQGQAGTFDQLAVSVDPDNAVAEADKDNNVAVVDRASLEAR